MTPTLARPEHLRAFVVAEIDREQSEVCPNAATLDTLQELLWEVRARLLREERWAMGVAS